MRFITLVPLAIALGIGASQVAAGPLGSHCDPLPGDWCDGDIHCNPGGVCGGYLAVCSSDDQCVSGACSLGTCNSSPYVQKGGICNAGQHCADPYHCAPGLPGTCGGWLAICSNDSDCISNSCSAGTCDKPSTTFARIVRKEA